MNSTVPEREYSESADLYLIILPAIVIFGLCGNIISLVTIFHSRLREVTVANILSSTIKLFQLHISNRRGRSRNNAGDKLEKESYAFNH